MIRLLLPLSLALVPLAACSGGGGNAAGANGSGSAASPSAEKVAAVVAGDRELERLNRIVGNAGLVDLLNGVGPYTIFAPNNAALEALGNGRADALAGEEMRPQAVALLRAHIVPGTLTRRDLAAALDVAGNRPVRMRTMAGTMLTFARDGDAIAVSPDGGGRARLSGDEKVGANGAVQPVDGLLVSTNGASR
jgi:uncharacterized surface protein with fasciclin (FAS1) repeats